MIAIHFVPDELPAEGVQNLRHGSFAARGLLDWVETSDEFDIVHLVGKRIELEDLRPEEVA